MRKPPVRPPGTLAVHPPDSLPWSPVTCYSQCSEFPSAFLTPQLLNLLLRYVRSSQTPASLSSGCSYLSTPQSLFGMFVCLNQKSLSSAIALRHYCRASSISILTMDLSQGTRTRHPINQSSKATPSSLYQITLIFFKSFAFYLRIIAPKLT